MAIWYLCDCGDGWLANAFRRWNTNLNVICIRRSERTREIKFQDLRMQPPCLHQAINCRLLWLCYIWYHFDCITRAVASKPHGAHSTSLYEKRTSHSVNTLPNDKCKLDCRQAGETGEIQLKKNGWACACIRKRYGMNVTADDNNIIGRKIRTATGKKRMEMTRMRFRTFSKTKATERAG